MVFLDAAIGFNVETVQYNNIKFQVWDLGMSLDHFLLMHRKILSRKVDWHIDSIICSPNVHDTSL